MDERRDGRRAGRSAGQRGNRDEVAPESESNLIWGAGEWEGEDGQRHRTLRSPTRPTQAANRPLQWTSVPARRGPRPSFLPLSAYQAPHRLLRPPLRLYISSPETAAVLIPLLLPSTTTIMSASTQAVASLHSEVSRLRHELTTVKNAGSNGSVSTVAADTMYVGQYLVERIVQLGVTVCSPAHACRICAQPCSPENVRRTR